MAAELMAAGLPRVTGDAGAGFLIKSSLRCR